MSHPAPTGDHTAGHHAGGFGAGPEFGAHAHAHSIGAPQPQWAPDPTYGAPPPPSSAYQPPQAGGYPQQYVPGMNPTNALAIASLVVALIGWSPIAIILGHIALGQIRRSNGYERGEGLAIAGLIIGYAELALALVFVLALMLGVSAFSGGPQPTVPPSFQPVN